MRSFNKNIEQPSLLLMHWYYSLNAKLTICLPHTLLYTCMECRNIQNFCTLNFCHLQWCLWLASDSLYVIWEVLPWDMILSNYRRIWIFAFQALFLLKCAPQSGKRHTVGIFNQPWRSGEFLLKTRDWSRHVAFFRVEKEESMNR